MGGVVGVVGVVVCGLGGGGVDIVVWSWGMDCG